MKKSLVSLALLSLLSASHSFANVSINVGAIGVMPNDSSSSLDVVESVAGLTPNSTQVHVNDNVQLGLTIDYAINDQWTLELIAATPFEHNVRVEGSAINGLAIGKTKHLPPTFMVQYHFPIEGSVKPFVGLGVNYTTFFDESASPELAGALTSLGVMQTGDKLDLALSDSWGAAAQIGVNIELTERVGIHVMASKMKIDTTGRVKLNGNSIQNVDVKIDPLVAMIGVRFAL